MKKILIHLHIYYHELYDELKNYIIKISPQKFDIFVTMVEKNDHIIKDIEENFKNATIDIVENRGYDVGPFIHVLNKVNLDDYSYILKLHTKRNVQYGANLYGYDVSENKWRDELLSFLKDWDKLIYSLENNKEIGMIGGINVILNKKQDSEYKKIKNEIINTYKLIDEDIKNKDYNFIAGTMFIVRSKLFKKIQNKFKIEDFEKPQKEATLAHKLERVFGMLIYNQGYRISDVEDNFNNKFKFYKIINKLKYEIKKFIFQKKLTKKNKFIVKIFKIPIIYIK